MVIFVMMCSVNGRGGDGASLYLAQMVGGTGVDNGP